MSLNLDDIQGVEVGDKQVGLSVGCTRDACKVTQLSRCDAVLLVAVLMQHKAARVFTKGQRQAAPLNVLSAASSPICVHKHSKLCHINKDYSTVLCGLLVVSKLWIKIRLTNLYQVQLYVLKLQ